MKQPLNHANILIMLLMITAIAFASTDADYSAALQTHFAKGTLGSPGKTRPIEMFFQNVFKSGKVYSVSGKSKTSAAEDVFAGTLTISGIAAGGSCASGETEIKGSYDLNEKESKTSGSFKGTFTACEKSGKLSKASFKGNWVKHATGAKTPCDFELGASLGSLTYNGQTYKTVKIGSQTWMAENLNYNAKNSKCYSDKEANCKKYGRLYNWATAMDLPANCNSSECEKQIKPRHKGICPQGWHIPSSEETNQLFRFVDGDKGIAEGESIGDRYTSEGAGKHLKAKESWNNYEGKSGNGTDSYGFALFPNGLYVVDANSVFGGIGDVGGWWIAAENTDTGCYVGAMSSEKDVAAVDNKFTKAFLFGVRCVMD